MISIPLAILSSLVTLYFRETLNMTLGLGAGGRHIGRRSDRVTIEIPTPMDFEEGMLLSEATLHGAAKSPYRRWFRRLPSVAYSRP
jgi:hypothetical protein